MVLLADVRSVGVQDGRTYGHPIVLLRPVSSGGRHDRRLDPSVLYDVLEAISTCASHNEVPTTSTASSSSPRAAGHHRMG